jgi:hypothetical protein
MDEDREVFVTLSNFQSPDSKLDFGDFEIFKVEPGPVAAGWRRNFNSSRVPEWILAKTFRNYVIEDDDLSGSDNIIRELQNILFLLRLFRSGDLIFSNILVRTPENANGSTGVFNIFAASQIKYHLKLQDVGSFTDFRNQIQFKRGYKNRFYDFFRKRFMEGMDSFFFYSADNYQRIVDYVIALESIFLIDNPTFYKQRIFSRRISQFLENLSVEATAAEIYKVRSNIVHGTYIALSQQQREKRTEKLHKHFPAFESLIRNCLRKLFDYDFQSKMEIVKFMKKLYIPPREATKVLAEAADEAEKAYSAAERGSQS